MIRIYSDELVVLAKKKRTFRGTPIAEITAEATMRGKPKEVTVCFYGEKANEAMEKLIPGVRFTFRGANTIDEETGKLQMAAATFAVIA